MAWTDVLWSLVVLPGWTCFSRPTGSTRVTSSACPAAPGGPRERDPCRAGRDGAVVAAQAGHAAPGRRGGRALVISVFALAISVSVLRIAARRALRRLLGAERVVIVGDVRLDPAARAQAVRPSGVRHGAVGAVSDPDAAGTAGLPVLADPGALDLRRLARSTASTASSSAARRDRGPLADLVRSAHRIELKVDSCRIRSTSSAPASKSTTSRAITVFSALSTRAAALLPRRQADHGHRRRARRARARRAGHARRRRRREAGLAGPGPLPAAACGSRRPTVLGAQVPHDGRRMPRALRAALLAPEPRSALAVAR